MPAYYHPSLVHSLHSRSVGILLDATKHCRNLLCTSCECCVQYEVDFQDVITSKQESMKSQKMLLRSNSRPLVVDGVAIPSSMHRRASKWKSKAQSETQILQAFAVLAPPVSSSQPREMLKVCCVRLHLILTSLRKLVSERVKSVFARCLKETEETELWYLSVPEFIRVLMASGVNWMGKSQMEETWKSMDLNKSGRLHIAELMEVLEEVDCLCMQILRDETDQAEFLGKLTSNIVDERNVDEHSFGYYKQLKQQS
jgi:hypothetical protein